MANRLSSLFPVAADAFRLLLLLLEMIPFLKDNKIKPSYILPSGVHELATDYLFGREASLDVSKATEGNIEDMIQAVDPNLAKAMLYIVILVGVFIILPLILMLGVSHHAGMRNFMVQVDSLSGITRMEISSEKG